METFFRKAYWILLSAAIAITLFLGTAIWGALMSSAAVLCSFAWPRQSDDALQKLCLAAAVLCFIGAMFGGFTQGVWLWSGVAIFGVLASTVKMQ